MEKGFFITGTDTGVGKTYVAAGIAASLRDAGVNVGVMKPVETGCRIRHGKMIPKDAVKLMRSAGVCDSLALVNPYRFRKPLAPSVAAEMEGGKIDLKTIRHAFQELTKRHGCMIVEGAGGIMVPLSGRSTYLDLARSLALPIIIVARPGLGSINHTLLTIAAIQQQKIVISGIVINYAEDQKTGIAERTNPMQIERISGIRILGTIPFGSKRFDNILDSLEIQKKPPH